jgi:hypothetical protein
MLMGKFIACLPDRRSILGVYATAVFLVYSWTLFASFWKVPSWLFFLNLSEILSIYAYSFVIDFAESLALLFFMLLVGMLLPRRWWNAQFTTMGVVWLMVLMGSTMIRLYTNRTPDGWEEFVYHQWAWWGPTLLFGLTLSFIFSYVSWLRKGLENFVDRLIVFLYLYLPLTALSVIVVLARIIF